MISGLTSQRTNFVPITQTERVTLRKHIRAIHMLCGKVPSVLLLIQLGILVTTWL